MGLHETTDVVGQLTVVTIRHGRYETVGDTV